MIRAYGILLRHIQSCAKELFLFFMLMCPNYTSTYFFPMNHVYYEHTLRQKNVPSKMQEDIILPCLLVETFSSSPIPTSFNIWTLFTFFHSHSHLDSLWYIMTFQLMYSPSVGRHQLKSNCIIHNTVAALFPKEDLNDALCKISRLIIPVLYVPKPNSY